MTPEPGLRERKKLESRRHIATTALEMFLERGFDQVSVAEVAAAAGVSKMTVFNHFPAKEDLVFELSGRFLPDLATAVRERGAGVTAIAAVHAAVLEDFRHRGEVTDQVRIVAFLKMAFRSPTLIARFGRQWSELQLELAAAFAEAIGVPLPPENVEELFMDAVRGDADHPHMADWLRTMGPDAMRPHFAAGQVISALQQLTMTNLVRMAAGIPMDEASEVARRDVDTAFTMLEQGLADFGVRPGSGDQGLPAA